MMSALHRFAAILSMVAMLATLSFAAPACSLCAPAVKSGTAQAHKVAHDHCGSMQADSQNATHIAISHCGHEGAVCMTASQRDVAALQVASSVQVGPALSSRVTPVEVATNSSPPDIKPLDQSQNLVLLTANLRV
jgi:hypothetical protein